MPPCPGNTCPESFTPNVRFIKDSIKSPQVPNTTIVPANPIHVYQFVAGMNHADNILAINSDAKANIFKTANYAMVGDIYEIIPQLMEKIKGGEAVVA